MNYPGDLSPDLEKKPQLPLKVLLQVVDETGISADYFNELRSIQPLIQDLGFSLSQSFDYILESAEDLKKDWKIQTYSEYRDGVKGDKGCLFDVDHRRVILIDKLASRMNQEIQSYRTKKQLNASVFLECWNLINLLVYGKQKFILAESTQSS